MKTLFNLTCTVFCVVMYLGEDVKLMMVGSEYVHTGQMDVYLNRKY